MARTTTSSISVDLSFARTQTGTNQTLAEQSNTKITASMTHGTGVGQVNAAWRGTGTISMSGTLLLDLEALNRKVFGSTQTVDFVNGNIKSIVIANSSTSALKKFVVQSTGAYPLKGIFNGTGNIVVHGQGAYLYTNLSGLPITSGNKQIFLHDIKSGSNYDISIVGVTGAHESTRRFTENLRTEIIQTNIHLFKIPIDTKPQMFFKSPLETMIQVNTLHKNPIAFASGISKTNIIIPLENRTG